MIRPAVHTPKIYILIPRQRRSVAGVQAIVKQQADQSNKEDQQEVDGRKKQFREEGTVKTMVRNQEKELSLRQSNPLALG